MKKNSGFTLIELIMVLVILGIIAAVTSKILATGLSGYLVSKNLTEADWQGQLGLERMVRDLRETRSPSDITTATSTQFVFTNISGSSVTYQLTGTNLMRNTQILASGVNSLTFNYYDANGTITAVTSAISYIRITLNITLNSTNFTIITAVNLPNLG